MISPNRLPAKLKQTKHQGSEELPLGENTNGEEYLQTSCKLQSDGSVRKILKKLRAEAEKELLLTPSISLMGLQVLMGGCRAKLSIDCTLSHGHSILPGVGPTRMKLG